MKVGLKSKLATVELHNAKLLLDRNQCQCFCLKTEDAAEHDLKPSTSLKGERFAWVRQKYMEIKFLDIGLEAPCREKPLESRS